MNTKDTMCLTAELTGLPAATPGKLMIPERLALNKSVIKNDDFYSPQGMDGWEELSLPC